MSWISLRSPFKPCLPVVCFDERSCILRADTHPSESLKPGRLTRQDDEYERRGTCNVFMFFQPLAGWRQTRGTAGRRKEDFAEWMREARECSLPLCRKHSCGIGQASIPTHHPHSMRAFEPARAAAHPRIC